MTEPLPSSRRRVPRCATHGYSVDLRYDLGGAGRPMSVVLAGDVLLVLAVDQRDNLFVHRYDLTGEPRGALGPYVIGDGDAEIGEPAGLALDDAGNLYLLDASGCRVHKLDPGGSLLSMFGSPGIGPRELRYPKDIEIGPDGSMLLADTGNNRVQRWDPGGDLAVSIGPSIDEEEDVSIPAGAGPGEFNAPSGVTEDADGNIYVADTNNHRIQIFDRRGSFLRSFGVEGDGSGQILFPTDVRVNAAGDIFVFDLHDRRVQKFSPRGELVYGIALDFGGVGQGQSIGDIDIGEDESIYVPIPGQGAVVRVTRVEG